MIYNTSINSNSIRLVIIFALCFFVFQSGRAQSPTKFVRSVDEHLEQLRTEDNFSGVVLIAKDGKPVLRKAYGFSNLADRIPNRPDTKFNLASMNKMFTGIAVMQLVEKGKISLQDKVGKYLPDFPNKEIVDSVTIEQLLTHTSGMGNFWEEFDKAAKEKFRTVADYTPLFAGQKLLFPPGKSFAYSNSGFMVLGLIIEKVTGESYYDHVRENIYIPSQMTNTDAYEADQVIPNVATGYSMPIENPGLWKNNLFTGLVKGTPAGGGYSTADDLLKFANALQSNKLLNEADTKLVTTGKIEYAKGFYGYGFTEEKANGHRITGHAGGNTGIANEMMIYSDLGYVVIILTNGEVENYWEASNFIKKQLIGPTPALDNYFYTMSIIKTVRQSGFAAGIELLQKKPANLALRESVIERIGDKLLFEKKNKESIDVFRFNVFSFPKSAYVYNALADAYRITGNKTLAIENYKKYLAIEPGDKEAEVKLAGLASEK